MTDRAPDRQIRPFAAWLTELNDGASHIELSNKLNQLVDDVAHLGKQGTLTYTIKIKPAGRNNDTTVMITDTITLKAPEGDRPDSIWYIDHDGNPVRHNPDQQRLPLREVPRPAIVADPETGEVLA
jgi:hypothetical protein